MDGRPGTAYQVGKAPREVEGTASSEAIARPLALEGFPSDGVVQDGLREPLIGKAMRIEPKLLDLGQMLHFEERVGAVQSGQSVKAV